MKIQISEINACKALFFSISFFVGLWAIRIPDIKDQINVDYSGMGYLFVIFSIGSVLTMIAMPKIMQLYPSKKISLLDKQLQLLHGDNYNAEDVFALNKKHKLNDD